MGSGYRTVGGLPWTAWQQGRVIVLTRSEVCSAFSADEQNDLRSGSLSYQQRGPSGSPEWQPWGVWVLGLENLEVRGLSAPRWPQLPGKADLG